MDLVFVDCRALVGGDGTAASPVADLESAFKLAGCTARPVTGLGDDPHQER